MKYLLDTNILLIYLRDQRTKSFIEENYQPFDLPNIPIIPVVNVGEIKSAALRNNWGMRRFKSLTTFLDELVIADIN
jgi:predicted nucleic acid-binding protein